MFEVANCRSESLMNSFDYTDSNFGPSVRKLDSTSTIQIVNSWNCYCGYFLQIIKSIFSNMLSTDDMRLKNMLTIMTSPPMHNSSTYRNR
jgi:hypothetical protein